MVTGPPALVRICWLLHEQSPRQIQLTCMSTQYKQYLPAYEQSQTSCGVAEDVMSFTPYAHESGNIQKTWSIASASHICSLQVAIGYSRGWDLTNAEQFTDPHNTIRLDSVFVYFEEGALCANFEHCRCYILRHVPLVLAHL